MKRKQEIKSDKLIQCEAMATPESQELRAWWGMRDMTSSPRKTELDLKPPHKASIFVKGWIRKQASKELPVDKRKWEVLACVLEVRRCSFPWVFISTGLPSHAFGNLNVSSQLQYINKTHERICYHEQEEAETTAGDLKY